MDELAEVLADHGLVEEGDAAVEQAQDGGRPVGPQLAGQAPLVPQVHDADADAWETGQHMGT